MKHQQSSSDPWLQDPLPAYGTLTPADYHALGLRVGLEIHQQLLTERKLFCRCPAGVYSQDHDAEILRHMRPTLSEMGEYDGTALMEFKTKKQIIYLMKNESVCTYEMDDAPPFELNLQALERATAIALLLGCKIVGELHITRKQYLDGSIPTGFQRTTIVGVDGAIPLHGRQIFIRQLALEEDSCREVADRQHWRTFRTDRLGMPLIETVTGPDMRTPEEAAAVGQILRRLVRISGLVRTGPGAARQDVNVSIDGGTRIEIKGVSSLRAIPKLVHCEALRQRSLLAIRDVLRQRGIRKTDIVSRAVDVTSIVKGTACRFIHQAIEKGALVKAVPLPGFEGLLNTPTQPRATFLREFSDRIRVIACIDESPNVACSTHEAATLSSSEWDKVGKACGVAYATPVLIVWGRPEDVQTASLEIVIRAQEATEGVPSETRQAMPDGTNGFERILPGPDRMYPDTDLPPITLQDSLMQKIAAQLPETPWQRQEKLRQCGVGADLAERLSRHEAHDLFWQLQQRLDAAGRLDANGLASLLLDRACPCPADPAAALAWWQRMVDGIVAGRYVPEAVWGCESEPALALPEAEGKRLFAQLLDQVPAGGPAGSLKREGFVMDHVMHKLRGKIAGRTVRQWVKEALA
jgi:glutamyl-tRNA(Gln) amidotransferase subunit E